LALYVVDASVAAKWYAAEELSTQAERLLDTGNELLAPLFILVELNSVFLKKTRFGQMTAQGATESLRHAVDTFEFTWSLGLLDGAFSLALQHNRSFYDSLYLALAIREGCRLVTADERLYNALRSSLPETMLWVGDLPAPA
jgi:predicted nucleic acid-binding protein